MGAMLGLTPCSGPGYRIILLAGGGKMRQQQDIKQAKELWAAHKRRMKEDR